MGRNADGSWSVVSLPGDRFRGGGSGYSPERQLAASAYASRQAGYRCANVFRWLAEFDSATPPYPSLSDLSDDRCRYTFYDIMQSAIYQDDDLARVRLVNRALFKFYTAFLQRGLVDEVAKNLTEDTRNCDVNYRKRFDVVLNLVAKRDPETLDLHQPLVQQLLRFSPFSRQGPEMPDLVVREVLRRLPEDIIGRAPQRRAAFSIWAADGKDCLQKNPLHFRPLPQTLTKAFGGRGQARYPALLRQNLAPECKTVPQFNGLYDKLGDAPAATEVTSVLQTMLRRSEGPLMCFRELAFVSAFIDRIPDSGGQQRVKAVINRATLAVGAQALL